MHFFIVYYYLVSISVQDRKITGAQVGDYAVMSL